MAYVTEGWVSALVRLTDTRVDGLERKASEMERAMTDLVQKISDSFDARKEDHQNLGQQLREAIQNVSNRVANHEAMRIEERLKLLETNANSTTSTGFSRNKSTTDGNAYKGLKEYNGDVTKYTDWQWQLNRVLMKHNPKICRGPPVYRVLRRRDHERRHVGLSLG